MPQPGRLITAMVTPFDGHRKVDYDRMAELAVRLAEAGSDLLLSGTTGESPTISAGEKLGMFRVVRDAVGDDVAILAGTGSNDTAKSIELTEQATELGVLDAILLVCPYYNKPSQEGFYQHFRAVARSTDLPVVLYNVPGRTGSNIEPSTVMRLADDVDNIVGIKDASGNLHQTAEICQNPEYDFRLWSGDDAMTLPILSLGGYGIISVASNIPDVAQDIGDMITCFREGQLGRAAESHGMLMQLFDACFLPSGNPACVKRALEICGIPVGGLRLPLVEASEKDTAIIREACERLGYA